jgi:integrase
MIMRDTGLRRATVARLVIDDFIVPPTGSRGALLQIRGFTEKNHKTPTCPLRADTIAELRAVIAERPRHAGPLLFGRFDCRGIVRPRIELPTWNKWLRQCGCPPDAHGRYGLHALRKARRTAAVDRARVGAHDLGLAEVMLDAEGHRDLRTLRTYLVRPEYERALKLLPEAPAPVRAAQLTTEADGAITLELERPDGTRARAHLDTGSPEWQRLVGFLETDASALAVTLPDPKKPL